MPKRLQGKRVLVTRARRQNEILIRALADQGAIPVELPTLQFALPDDPTPLDQALTQLNNFHWLIFTSANGVTFFRQRLAALGIDPAKIAALRIAAIGPATAAALSDAGWRVDLIPAQHIAEGLVAAMPDVAGERILLPVANLAQPTLAGGLRANGAIVERVVTYQTQPAPPPGDLAGRLAGVDVVTFTSSSTVQNLLTMIRTHHLETSLERAVIACIGPKTAQTAQSQGLSVSVIAGEHTTAGLVTALVDYFRA